MSQGGGWRRWQREKDGRRHRCPPASCNDPQSTLTSLWPTGPVPPPPQSQYNRLVGHHAANSTALSLPPPLPCMESLCRRSAAPPPQKFQCCWLGWRQERRHSSSPLVWHSCPFVPPWSTASAHHRCSVATPTIESTVRCHYHPRGRRPSPPPTDRHNPLPSRRRPAPSSGCWILTMGQQPAPHGAPVLGSQYQATTQTWPLELDVEGQAASGRRQAAGGRRRRQAARHRSSHGSSHSRMLHRNIFGLLER